ncbi:MAG: hypothetical protein K2H16_01275, partial [Prevotella sp.]|nr:hypothetical protein [Prevotella sp.]
MHLAVPYLCHTAIVAFTLSSVCLKSQTLDKFLFLLDIVDKETLSLPAVAELLFLFAKRVDVIVK